MLTENNNPTPKQAEQKTDNNQELLFDVDKTKKPVQEKEQDTKESQTQPKKEFNAKKFASTKNLGKKEIYRDLAKTIGNIPYFNNDQEFINYIKDLHEKTKGKEEPKEEVTPDRKQVMALAKKNERLLEEMNRLKSEVDKKEQEFKDKQKQAYLKDQLSKVLEQAKCNNIRLAMNDPDLRNRIEVDEGNNIFIKDKLGQTVGDEESLHDLIEEYKNNNPQIFTVIQPKSEGVKTYNNNTLKFNPDIKTPVYQSKSQIMSSMSESIDKFWKNKMKT